MLDRTLILSVFIVDSCGLAGNDTLGGDGKDTVYGSTGGDAGFGGLAGLLGVDLNQAELAWL